MKHPIRSRIANKISRKMLLVYISIYVIILTLLMFLLIPTLYQNTLNRAMQTLDSMATEYHMVYQSMEEAINCFYLSTNLENALEAYAQDRSAPNKNQIILALGEISAGNSRSFSACIENPEGDYFASYTYTDIDKQALLHRDPRYMELLSHSYGSVISPLNSGIFSDSYASYDCFSYSKNLSLASRTYTGTVFYNASAFMEQSRTLSSISFMESAITDQNGNRIYSSSDSFFDEQVSKKLRQTKNISGHFPYQKGIVFYQIVPSNAHTILTYASYLHLFASPLMIIAIITFLYALSPLLYGLLLHPITSAQLSPLKRLANAMKSYAAGEDMRVDIDTNDEIEEISDTFNTMVVDIRQKIQEIQEHERRNAVTSYKLLSTQVNPHFIYNTMNIINVMAKAGNTDAVIELNCALIKILQERLNSKISIFETVRNEIDTLRQYCTIINYRYQNLIAVHYDIDQTLYEKWIPKNILQPLAENCFFHAFSELPKNRQGNINIMIYSIDREMTIEVSDDGKGITQKRIDEIMQNSQNIYSDKKPHIGIGNIRQRLSYLYHENYDFIIQSSEGHGTTIIITIPELSEKPAGGLLYDLP